MKATFSTQRQREQRPLGLSYQLPLLIDPYFAAVLTTHLQAIAPEYYPRVHSVDGGFEIVVDLLDNTMAVADIDEERHAALQAVVDQLTAAPERLCVFVPCVHNVVPREYQAARLPYVRVGSDVVWDRLPLTQQPALFADLRHTEDFSAEARAIHDATLAALVREYVEQAGAGTRHGGAVTTPVVWDTARQDLDMIVEVLRVYLWRYPDTVRGRAVATLGGIVWTWAETIDVDGTDEPYGGPPRAGRDPSATVNVTNLPNGYLPLGFGRALSDAVQITMGTVLDLVEWNDNLILVGGDLREEAVLCARSLQFDNALKHADGT